MQYFPTVEEYYNKKESKLGYLFVMKQSQHVGYYKDKENSTEIGEKLAQRNLHDKIVEYIDPGTTDKILDVGCGQGFVACDLAKRYSLNITGIDITPYMVKRAKNLARRKKVQEKTDFVVGDYSEKIFNDQQFNHIYAVETLCHSRNLEKTLKEFFRILKPNGLFLSLEYILKPDKLVGTHHEKTFYKHLSQYTSAPSLHYFEKEKFSQLATKVGFELVKEIDVTNNCYPSIVRFDRLARIPYGFIKALNLEGRYVNTWIAGNCKEVVDLGYWGYMHRIYRKG